MTNARIAELPDAPSDQGDARSCRSAMQLTRGRQPDVIDHLRNEGKVKALSEVARVLKPRASSCS